MSLFELSYGSLCLALPTRSLLCTRRLFALRFRLAFREPAGSAGIVASFFFAPKAHAQPAGAPQACRLRKRIKPDRPRYRDGSCRLKKRYRNRSVTTSFSSPAPPLSPGGLLRTWASHPTRTAGGLSTNRALRFVRLLPPLQRNPAPRISPFVERMRGVWGRARGAGISFCGIILRILDQR